MDRLKKSIEHDPSNRDNGISEKVYIYIYIYIRLKNIRTNYKLYHEAYGKLESGTHSRRTNPSRGNIRWGIFLRHLLSALLFVIAMMPLNYVLRKHTGGAIFF